MAISRLTDLKIEDRLGFKAELEVGIIIEVHVDAMLVFRLFAVGLVGTRRNLVVLEKVFEGFHGLRIADVAKLVVGDFANGGGFIKWISGELVGHHHRVDEGFYFLIEGGSVTDPQEGLVVVWVPTYVHNVALAVNVKDPLFRPHVVNAHTTT